MTRRSSTSAGCESSTRSSRPARPSGRPGARGRRRQLHHRPRRNAVAGRRIGCGKTTTSRCILRAITPTAGEIRFRTASGAEIDVARLARKQLRPLRRQMQMIFQDPFSSLNPRMTIAEIIGEPLLVNGMGDTRARNDARRGTAGTGATAAAYLNRFPACVLRRPAPAHRHRPRTCAAPGADRGGRTGVRAGRLGAGADRQPDAGTAGPAGHRLSVRRARPVGGEACQPPRRGDVCRAASSRSRRPRHCSPRRAHPYTEALLSAVPVPDPRLRAQRIVLEGEVADPANPPPGCAFHPRCRYATEQCRQVVPALEELAPGHWVRCLRARELALQPVSAAGV